jgi:hypothetical protein
MALPTRQRTHRSTVVRLATLLMTTSFSFVSRSGQDACSIPRSQTPPCLHLLSGKGQCLPCSARGNSAGRDPAANMKIPAFPCRCPAGTTGRAEGSLNHDGFVRSPSAALRFILALLNSRGARLRSRFNRVNHCSVLLCTPHSSRSSRLVPPGAGELFTVPSTSATSHELVNHDPTKTH